MTQCRPSTAVGASAWRDALRQKQWSVRSSFTHDIYFLCLLAEEAKKAGATMVTQSLTRRAEGFGIADPELPFEGKNTSKRIGALKAQQQIIAKLHKEGNEQEHHKQTVDAYFRLRMAWERAVEEVLLREVILRFRKSVETQRLVDVSVDDNDYAQVYAGMSKCSNYAHDKAIIGGIAIPDPDELRLDILALENWCAVVLQRSKETKKQRKAYAPLAAPITASCKASAGTSPAARSDEQMTELHTVIEG